MAPSVKGLGRKVKGLRLAEALATKTAGLNKASNANGSERTTPASQMRTGIMRQITLHGRDTILSSTVGWQTAKSLPNLFYIGPARSGSTSFFSYCRNTSDIFTPGLKETNFLTCFDMRFSGPGDKQIFHSGINFANLDQGGEQHCAITTSLSDYLALYTMHQKEKWVVDISPSYSFYFDRFARNVGALTDVPSVIFLPRDPVDRAISNYKSLFGRKPPETILETYGFEQNRLARGWEFYWSICGQGQYSRVVQGLKDCGIRALVDTYERVYGEKSGAPISDFLQTEAYPVSKRANKTERARFIELVDRGDLIFDAGEPTEAYLNRREHDPVARRGISIDDDGNWAAEMCDATIINLLRPFVADVMQLVRMPELTEPVSNWTSYKQMKRLKLLR